MIMIGFFLVLVLVVDQVRIVNAEDRWQIYSDLASEICHDRKSDAIPVKDHWLSGRVSLSHNTEREYR